MVRYALLALAICIAPLGVSDGLVPVRMYEVNKFYRSDTVLHRRWSVLAFCSWV